MLVGRINTGILQPDFVPYKKGHTGDKSNFLLDYSNKFDSLLIKIRKEKYKKTNIIQIMQKTDRQAIKTICQETV